MRDRLPKYLNFRFKYADDVYGHEKACESWLNLHSSLLPSVLFLRARTRVNTVLRRWQKSRPPISAFCGLKRAIMRKLFFKVREDYN